jgi:hypothetical protein
MSAGLGKGSEMAVFGHKGVVLHKRPMRERLTSKLTDRILLDHLIQSIVPVITNLDKSRTDSIGSLDGRSPRLRTLAGSELPKERQISVASLRAVTCAVPI